MALLIFISYHFIIALSHIMECSAPSIVMQGLMICLSTCPAILFGRFGPEVCKFPNDHHVRTMDSLFAIT